MAKNLQIKLNVINRFEDNNNNEISPIQILQMFPNSQLFQLQVALRSVLKLLLLAVPLFHQDLTRLEVMQKSISLSRCISEIIFRRRINEVRPGRDQLNSAKLSCDVDGKKVDAEFCVVWSSSYYHIRELFHFLFPSKNFFVNK